VSSQESSETSDETTLDDLIRGDSPVTMIDVLKLKAIQCRHDIVAAAMKLIQTPKHAIDGYNILGPLAAEGDVEAQFFMGEICEFALGRPQQAAIWFQRAADQGHPQALRCYADMLMVGKGVDANPFLAAEYYERAAVAGVAEAQFVMGEILRNGHLMPKNDDMALLWYERARRQGYEPAAVRIGTFFPDAK